MRREKKKKTEETEGRRREEMKSKEKREKEREKRSETEFPGLESFLSSGAMAVGGDSKGCLRRHFLGVLEEP